MGAIADIFRKFGPEYLETFHEKIPANHRKVIAAIIACRTKACGITVYGCLPFLRKPPLPNLSKP